MSDPDSIPLDLVHARIAELDSAMRELGSVAVALADKLDRQLIKHKEKSRGH